MTRSDKEKYKNIGMGLVAGLLVTVFFPWVGNKIESLLNGLGV